MRRFLYPTVVLIALVVVLSAVAIWRVVRHKKPIDQNLPAVSLPVSPVPPSNPEAERYAVYSAVIGDMYSRDGATKLLVIQHGNECLAASTDVEASDEKVGEMRRDIEEYAIEELPDLQRETIDDFHIKAKECHPLTRQLDIPVKYVLVGDKELGPLFPKGEGDWRRFYKKYPQSSGIISFSPPGFNTEMNQALVSTARSCGSLCGSGYFVLLAREQGIWKVHTKIMTWVS